jgi:hypothetical protein
MHAGIVCLRMLAGHHRLMLSLPSILSALSSGVLACLDSFMNIAMEQTEEYVHGQLKAKYGDCFIRGNNGTFLCLAGCGWMHLCVADLIRQLSSAPCTCPTRPCLKSSRFCHMPK